MNVEDLLIKLSSDAALDFKSTTPLDLKVSIINPPEDWTQGLELKKDQCDSILIRQVSEKPLFFVEELTECTETIYRALKRNWIIECEAWDVSKLINKNHWTHESIVSLWGLPFVFGIRHFMGHIEWSFAVGMRPTKFKDED